MREGRGHEHGVGCAEPVRVHHRLRFVDQGAMGVEHAFRLAFRSARPQDRGQIGTAGMHSVVTVARLPCRDLGLERVVGEKQFGIERPDQSLGLGGPGLMMERRGDRSELPTGAVERNHFGPVRPLPRHDIAAPDSCGAEALCEGRFGTDDGRQRRDVPRSARCAVFRGPGVTVGGADAHRISAARTSTRARLEWHHAGGSSR